MVVGDRVKWFSERGERFSKGTIVEFTGRMVKIKVDGIGGHFTVYPRNLKLI